jgi:hypothetical protein
MERTKWNLVGVPDGGVGKMIPGFGYVEINEKLNDKTIDELAELGYKEYFQLKSDSNNGEQSGENQTSQGGDTPGAEGLAFHPESNGNDPGNGEELPGETRESVYSVDAETLRDAGARDDASRRSASRRNVPDSGNAGGETGRASADGGNGGSDVGGNPGDGRSGSGGADSGEGQKAARKPAKGK